MFPLAFVAVSLQGHWWGFISRNYVVWPIFFLMNVFIALKGTHFWILILPVAYLNHSNTVSFFLYFWPVYTLLGAIKRYGLQSENGQFQCLDTTLTLARAVTHAWMLHHRNKFYSNALRLTFPVINNPSGRQHKIRQNNYIYITSEMTLVHHSIQLSHVRIFSWINICRIPWKLFEYTATVYGFWSFRRWLCTAVKSGINAWIFYMYILLF